MIAAHQVGIPVFVTGGIGGVHRDGENSELTRLPFRHTKLLTKHATFVLSQCEQACHQVCHVVMEAHNRCSHAEDVM